MMVVFSWIGGIFLVLLTGILVYRSYINYQLKRLALEKVSSAVARKKLLFIKQREQEKHVQSLFAWGIGMTCFLFFLFYFTLTLQQKNHTLTNQLIQVNEEVLRLKTEQKQFIQQLPVMAYPEKGLSIETKQWKALLSTKDNRKLQGEMEQQLAQKFAPYLGLSTVVLSVDRAANQIDLSIQNEEREALNMKDVTSKIVKDFAKVGEVKTIHFQTVALTDEKIQPIGQWQYSRKDTEAFVLVSDAQ